MTASSSAALLPERLQTILRNDVQGMHAYAVQPSAGFIKLDAMENPFPLPPGLQAHLGLLYGMTGRGDLFEQNLLVEKQSFPESSVYLDFLLKQKTPGGEKAQGAK